MEQDKEQGQDQEQQGGGKREQDETYYYENSGIEERHGRVPLWLWAVAAGLLAWGIYYLAAYWSPPA